MLALSRQAVEGNALRRVRKNVWLHAPCLRGASAARHRCQSRDRQRANRASSSQCERLKCSSVVGLPCTRVGFPPGKTCNVTRSGAVAVYSPSSTRSIARATTNRRRPCSWRNLSARERSRGSRRPSSSVTSPAGLAREARQTSMPCTSPSVPVRWRLQAPAQSVQTDGAASSSGSPEPDASRALG